MTVLEISLRCWQQYGQSASGATRPESASTRHGVILARAAEEIEMGRRHQSLFCLQTPLQNKADRSKWEQLCLEGAGWIEIKENKLSAVCMVNDNDKDVCVCAYAVSYTHLRAHET